jgi:hypothetical protein
MSELNLTKMSTNAPLIFVTVLSSSFFNRENVGKKAFGKLIVMISPFCFALMMPVSSSDSVATVVFDDSDSFMNFR